MVMRSFNCLFTANARLRKRIYHINGSYKKDMHITSHGTWVVLDDFFTNQSQEFSFTRQQKFSPAETHFKGV